MSDADDLEVFRSVLEGLQVGVCIVDRERKVLFWNEGAEKITGYLRQDVVGRRCRDDILVDCSAPGAVQCESPACPLADAMREGKPKQSDLSVMHKQGHRVLVRGHHMPVRNSRGMIIGAAATFQEHNGFNPHRNRDLAEVGSQAFVEFHLRASLTRLAESQVPFAVLCVRIDHLAKFKSIHGAKAEAEIIRVVASSLQNDVRDSDFLGRWKDGQFLIVLSKCQPGAVDMVAQRIREVVGGSGIQWWGDRLSVTVSVGKAAAEPGDTIERLLQRVEKSLAEVAPAVSARNEN